MQRRSLLCGLAGLALTNGVHGETSTSSPRLNNQSLGASYDIASGLVNLENAYFGMMARPVVENYKRNIDYVNKHNSHFLRSHFDREGIESIRQRVAAHSGVPTNDIAITRGATESLQCIIANYKPLRAGEAVMIANLDYGTVTDAMRDLALRRGAKVVTVELPDMATRQNVLNSYQDALKRNPTTRLLLLTHVSHRTGLILPVAEIVRMAKLRNVDVVVDIAQSWGQLDFKIPDLGADFVGANLHKWIGAPLGLGFLYIRSNRLSDIATHQGNTEFADNDVRARTHPGTLNIAAVMTIPAALDFHETVALRERAALLRGLRDYWVLQARTIPGVQILTPDDPGMTGAITSFRLSGHTSLEANVALTRRLEKEYRIFTVARNGPAGGSCIRVTPSYYTRLEELDRFVAALRSLAT